MKRKILTCHPTILPVGGVLELSEMRQVPKVKVKRSTRSRCGSYVSRRLSPIAYVIIRPITKNMSYDVLTLALFSLTHPFRCFGCGGGGGGGGRGRERIRFGFLPLRQTARGRSRLHPAFLSRPFLTVFSSLPENTLTRSIRPQSRPESRDSDCDGRKKRSNKKQG